MKDEEYMRLAIELAKKGEGYVNPNPMVGAVLVKDDKIIGKGYHAYYGGLHAERNAINNCRESVQGACLYVTLEPCCHYGKTPPCVEVIIESGISKVVIGTLDVNPKMSGKSIEILKQHSIKVIYGVLEEECKKLNKVFCKFITTQQPYVIMKYAMTMDGKIATHANHSKWISGTQARERVHQTRHAVSAIMVGVQTILQDDPLLTCRIENGKNPIRIVCDTNLRTPLTSQIVKTANSIRTYIATTCQDEKRLAPYREQGCQFIQVGKKESHIDLVELMRILGSMGMDSVLIEGGAHLNWSALHQRIVDELQVYIAPKIFGGIAKTPVSGEGVEYPDEAIQLNTYAVTKLGEDYLIESEVKYSCLRES